jgi:asparagine synthase (glutamine-hydrolysing)
MCGILTIFGKNIHNVNLDILLRKIVHRGPDNTSKYEDIFSKIGFVRLAIMDVFNGNQPFQIDNIISVTNGEIYNYKELKDIYFKDTNFKSNSDCEIIIHLYRKFGFEFMNKVEVKGMFAFVIYNTDSKEVIVGRDFMGIIPLYKSYDQLGNIYFCSELKAIDHCTNIKIYPPGLICKFSDGDKIDSYNYYKEKWFIDNSYIPNYRINTDAKFLELRNKFIDAVESHMMTDIKYGVLLSGGLDSSLVASIVKRKMVRDNIKENLNTFSIGLKGSPDLESAQKVADFLGTNHYGFTYTIEEGLSAIRDVIYHTETYDTTTIRASTPMYLLSRKIKSFGFKMVLSGEGADEMFGGYLYFHKAPNAVEFQKELVLKMKKLHFYDNLRANKSMLAWGIETRVPFQHKDMINYTMNIDPQDKMCGDKIQKYIIRKAFDDKHDPYLPEEILWRQKEQFSDGVGYGWIDSLKELGESQISDYQMKLVNQIYPKNTPNTKEEFLYRTIYESLFSKTTIDVVNFEKSIACSTASALKWEKLQNQTYDPSGLCIDTHIKN